MLAGQRQMALRIASSVPHSSGRLSRFLWSEILVVDIREMLFGTVSLNELTEKRLNVKGRDVRWIQSLEFTHKAVFHSKYQVIQFTRLNASQYVQQ